MDDLNKKTRGSLGNETVGLEAALPNPPILRAVRSPTLPVPRKIAHTTTAEESSSPLGSSRPRALKSPPRSDATTTSAREATPSPSSRGRLHQSPSVSPKAQQPHRNSVPLKRIKRQVGTRSARSAAEIISSVARSTAMEKGNEDAIREIREEKQSSEKEEKPPSILNPNPCPSAPRRVSHRFVFDRTASVPIWPVFVTFTLPYLCLCLLLSHVPMYLFVMSIGLLVWLQGWFLVYISSYLTSRSYLMWLLPHSSPPNLSSVAPDDVAELHHTEPETQLSCLFTLWYIWYLQCVSSVATPLIACVSGVAFHLGRSVEAKTVNDVRVPSQRGCACEKDQVVYDTWSIISLSSGLATVVVSCDAIKTQIMGRLRTLCSSDRRLQAESMATRVANIQVRAALQSEACRGSAEMALIDTTATDVSCGVIQQASSMNFLCWDYSYVFLCVGAMLVIIPQATTSASVISLTGYCYLIAVLVVAPLLEEQAKTMIGHLLGTGRLFSAPLFGFLELAGTLFNPNAVPAFFMHCCTGMFSQRHATLIHFAFNLFVVITVGYNSPSGGVALVNERADSQFVPLQTAMSELKAAYYAEPTVLPAPDVDLIDLSFLNATDPSGKKYDVAEIFLASNCHVSRSPSTYSAWRVDLISNWAMRTALWLCPAVLDPALALSDRQITFLQLCHFRSDPKQVAGDPRLADEFGRKWFINSRDLCPGMSLMALVMLLVPACLYQQRASLRATAAMITRTRYAIGYRVNEVLSKPVSEHAATITLLPTYFATCVRVVSCCTLGFSLMNVVPPFPDFYHPPTALHGCLNRFCMTPPRARARKLRLLRRYVRRYVLANYRPIASDADVSLETWLDGTDYPEWRKTQLRNVWGARPWSEAKDSINKSFIKKEFYGAYKPARGINSRTDNFKCATGPYFKHMESEVYHQECFDGEKLVPGRHGPFIKHIPVHLRPQFIADMLGSQPGPYYETDYSQFEKHFTPEIMHSLELILYKHMLHHFPDTYRLIESTISGKNVCRYRGFILKILGRRMSGDMCTSLGNGFSNLMLFMFVAHSKGGVALGIVEGDDALFVSTVVLTAEDFEEMGFVIKIHPYDSLFEASFCGMLLSQDGVLLRDITRVIPKFGWTFSPRREGSANVRMGLLRARALSLAYESPRCPILFALARRALEVTYGFKPIFEHSYHHALVAGWCDLFSKEMVESLALGPSLQARCDFATKFGISVPVQLRVEEIFSSWDGTPLAHPLVESLFHSCPDMFSFADRFVAEDKLTAQCMSDSIQC
jgi:hypothetical protein